MLDIKEYLKQTKTVLLTQDAFDELMQRAYAQPKHTEERTETHGVCLDAIDRQVVIDTVRKIILGFFSDSDKDGAMTDTEKTLLILNKAICNGIRELPSAQPEIVRCKDCLIHGVCRFEQGLGLDGYCSQAERRTDERSD